MRRYLTSPLFSPPHHAPFFFPVVYKLLERKMVLISTSCLPVVETTRKTKKNLPAAEVRRPKSFRSQKISGNCPITTLLYPDTFLLLSFYCRDQRTVHAPYTQLPVVPARTEHPSREQTHRLVKKNKIKKKDLLSVRREKLERRERWERRE